MVIARPLDTRRASPTFQLPNVIVLCHATPHRHRGRLGYRVSPPITSPMYLLRALLLFRPAATTSLPIANLLDSSRFPSHSSTSRVPSHSTRGQSKLRVMTSPFMGSEAPFHVAPVPPVRFFSNSFSRLAHLCLALIDPKWLVGELVILSLSFHSQSATSRARKEE